LQPIIIWAKLSLFAIYKRFYINKDGLGRRFIAKIHKNQRPDKFGGPIWCLLIHFEEEKNALALLITGQTHKASGF
jgi:hypothetical protein